MKLFRTGEFAQKAGVTVRTLRYYDRLGLLKPAAYSAAGQRLYSELDYARLQQIVTLKLIGLSLAAIKGLLTTEISEFSDLLERQKRVLAAQARQLAQVIATIEAAQRSIQTSQKLDLEQMITIIRAVNMNTQTNWLQSFLTDDQQAKLAEQVTGQTLADQKQV
ncbi:MAG TPA: MerR family transcriptional regulator, partial [Phototrophicaceae bacterium]|nr:MerR family transcriptional regulator [Phototrophicaceae bacterium]